MTNSKSQMGPKTGGRRDRGKWRKSHIKYDEYGNYLFINVAEICGGIAPLEAEATAAFIVKACNLHDELVEGLKLALTLNGNPRRDSEDNAEWDKVIDNIKNLIAKAQEA